MSVSLLRLPSAIGQGERHPRTPRYESFSVLNTSLGIPS